jgi:hypothetical protein
MYDSYSMPFLIISVIPFGVVGIFLSFYAHGLPLSMFAAMGLIGLSGIAVNDSVVLIDHIHGKILEAGKFSKELVIQSTVNRLRPIMLTTVSTLLGLVSTAYAIGGYDPLLSPLSLAIFYGLIFSTTVVLILLPTLYAIGADMSNFLAKFKKNKTAVGVVVLLIVATSTFTPPAKAKLISPQNISQLLQQTNEAKIKAEQLKQQEFQLRAVDGVLDTKLKTSIYKTKSINYPNPPMTLDADRDGYGMAIELNKMTAIGIGLGVGINLDNKQLSTIPANPQFGLDARDTSYSFKLSIPLLKNFGNRQYHLQKTVSTIQ